MSGVQRYVRRDGTPPSGQPSQHDRKAIALQAKMPTKKPKSNLPIHPQYLSSTAPAPGYDSNPTGARNTHPHHQYSHHAPPNNGFDLPTNMAKPERGFNGDDIHGFASVRPPFDDTMTSGFDQTRSDIGDNEHGTPHLGNPSENLTLGDEDYDEEDDAYSNEAAYPAHESTSPDLPRHKLHHQAGRSPIINNKAEPQNHHPQRGISGRFSTHIGGPTDMHPGTMQTQYDQSGQAEPQSRNDSKKRPRGHDEELRGEGDNQYGYEQQKSPRHRGDDIDQIHNGFDEVEARRAPFDPSAHGPDHSEEVLARMDYSQLKEQTWDVDDANVRGKQTGTLKSRFRDIIEGEGGQDTGILMTFFSSLSIAEWEEAGDLFIEKFSNLMKEMIKHRRARRAIMSKYENKIDDYEGLVRGKSEILEKKLKDMKRGGEGVLRGKMT